MPRSTASLAFPGALGYTPALKSRRFPRGGGCLTLNDRLPDLLSYTDSMLTWVSGRGRILVVVHDNPDPDSLASAMALRHLFAVRLNREAVIAFSGMIGRSENLAMAKSLQIPLTPFPIIELKMFQVVCLLLSLIH